MKVSVHMNGRGVIVPFVVVALFLAACGGDGASTVRPTSTPALRPTAEPTMEPEPTATEPIGTMKQYNEFVNGRLVERTDEEDAA